MEVDIPVVVTRRVPFGPQTWLLCWQRTFDFRAGQVVSLALPGGTPRMYSLATGAGETEAGVLFNEVEGGELTPALARLQPGDRLFVSRPFGSFSSPPGPGVWIANGTGIAPFLSMAASGLADGKVLVQGARNPEGFFGQQSFLKHAGLEYYRCASAESGEGLYSGRLTAFLEERTWPADRSYALCGSAAMIVDVRELLFRKGVPFRQVLSEVFF